MATDVAGHFPASRGMAHQSGISEIEFFDQCGEVVGIGIHVVAAGRLARPPVAAPVMGNSSISILRKKLQLAVPRVGAQGPTVRKGYDRAHAPLFVVDLGSVTDCDRAHKSLSFC